MSVTIHNYSDDDLEEESEFKTLFLEIALQIKCFLVAVSACFLFFAFGAGWAINHYQTLHKEISVNQTLHKHRLRH